MTTRRFRMFSTRRKGSRELRHHGRMAIIKIDDRGRVSGHFVGLNADEVQAIAHQLVEDVIGQRQAEHLRSPWFAGTFYLTVFVIVMVVLLAAGSLLSIWVLPVVLVAACLLLSIVGALQMRQDDRLSERGFLRLMGDVFRRLPLFFVGARSRAKKTTN